MIAHGAFAEPERGGDLRVRKSVRHEAQHLALPRSQRIGGGRWLQATVCVQVRDLTRGRQRGVQERPTGGDGVDRFDESLGVVPFSRKPRAPARIPPMSAASSSNVVNSKVGGMGGLARERR